jgi:6-phosphogluconolactonase (cycloisomerase 2 family)
MSSVDSLSASSRRTSRRAFLKSSAAFAVAAPAFARAQEREASSAPPPILTYVGTYSSPQGPEGALGRGQGIYLFAMNPATGALAARELFANDANPAWLAFDPSRTHLYSANEVRNFAGTDSGSVSAYAIDLESGRLTLLNTVSSEGAGPAHMSIHPSGKFALVANYQGGTVAVLPISAHGELGAATHVVHDEGVLGPQHAASAPAGSFAISGHDRPHAHMIESDPAGRYVFASDLGLDRIFIWRFDAENGRLIPNDPASVPLPPGDGPRHFAFHPQGRWFYSLQEEASTLVTYDYDASSGKLSAKQTISSLPKGFTGTNFTSEVMVFADGRFLYAANRLHDSIAWFTIGATGTLAFAGEEWTRGDYPRSFNIDPTGNFLYACNQRADAITTFRVNRNTGALTFTGQYTPVGTPASIIFLT